MGGVSCPFERTLRFEYKGQTSDWFGWMHIDPETLGQYVDEAGYSMNHLGSDGKPGCVPRPAPPELDRSAAS